jgi:hypothetical protein
MMHVSAAICGDLDEDGWAILTGVDVPTVGCWELTGWYRGNTLSFVVSIEP